MLINYIKITLAVMRRRKIFTFISMFGISFTLLILVLVTSFIEHVLGPNYPEWNRDKMAYIMSLKQQNEKGDSQRSGPMSFSFVQRYVKTLKTPEKVSLYSFPFSINTYANGKKISMQHRYTDAEFWELTQFDFLEGRPYTQQDIDQNAFVAVINERLRDDYFGKNADAIGKTIEVDNVSYRVVGVVRGVPIVRLYTASDIWSPYNTSKGDLKSPELNGSYMAMMSTKAGESPDAIKAEYAAVIPTIKPHDPELTVLSSHADTYTATFTRLVLDDNSDSGVRMLFVLLSAFALLFMLIPALNLVNLNISRILERASEIGVRRACGASAKQLIVQFTVENVLIAVMGGVIALVLAWVLIGIFNNSDIYPYADLRINWRVTGIAFILSIVFGLMSGVYPAWRMSKMDPAEALKSC